MNRGFTHTPNESLRKARIRPTTRLVSGFTLIETVIYLALLGIIMVGAVVTSYELMQSLGNLANKNTAQEEGSFVLRKLDWAFSSASGFTATPNALSVTRYDGTVVDMRLVGTRVEMRESGGVYTPITTENVTANSLDFQDIPAVGLAPHGVAVTLLLQGDESFSTTKYLRR